LGFLGVAVGAFGAHALADVLVDERLGWYQTATLYHLVPAVAGVAAGLAGARGGGRLLAAAGTCLAVGVAVFSGSLYVMAVTDMRWLGAVTPLGGVLLLVGWALFAAGAISATLRRP